MARELLTLATCCPPIGSTAVTDDAALTLARAFRALSDPSRVKLLSLVATAPGAEACLCDLIEPVGLSQPTVSHHMKQLVEAGLVQREQRGRWAYYSLVPQALRALAAALHAGES